jgi:hypothetical protein
MDEQTKPPMRKRSEVGRIGRVELPKPAAPTDSMENISEFVLSLKSAGYEVSLIEAARWGIAARAEVREWMRLDCEGTMMPSVIRALITGAIPVDENVAANDKLEADFAPPATNFEGSSADLPMVRQPQRPACPAPSSPRFVAVPPPAPSSPVVDYVVMDYVVSDSADYNRLVTTILKELDLDSEYAELERALEVGDNRRDYATVYEALDKAERRALRAHGVWANAKLEHEKLRLDQEEVNANLWKQAKTALEAMPAEEEDEEPIEEGKKAPKKAKARRKMITNGDVEAKIAEMFPDEWRGGRMRLERSKIAVERCERFADLWQQKVRSLNTMLSSVRK